MRSVGPITWTADWQEHTALSSCDAEIRVTNMGSRLTVNTRNMISILFDLGYPILGCTPPTHLYNDNDACVKWCHNMTTKGNHHIENRENSTREWVADGTISVPTSVANATLRTSSPRKCTTALIFVVSATLLCVAQATISKGFYLLFQTRPNLPHLHPFWHNPWRRSPSLAQACLMSWLPISVCEYPLPYPASPMPAAISSPDLRLLLICRFL